MTRLQIALYWREWALVRRVASDEASDHLRHELHVKALGVDKSSRALNNREFDRVLSEFRAISRPADLDAQLRQLAQPRRRILWKIKNEQRALLSVFMLNPDAYIAEILQARFHVERIDDLDDPETLRQFMMTLAARIDRMRTEAGFTVAEMKAKAGLR